MSLTERNAKIYGAVETETFVTYEGFCKKIYNMEQQKIEVYVDDKKIDTILANQKIPKIEDTYEVFNTEGFCFTYKLPKEYIGEKHKLEFKTIEGEQLVHSPITTIDSSDERYNECSFIESLNEPIDEEKIKDLYCPNSIGFLATQENLGDEEFVNYIKELMLKFPNTEFKGFYFDKNQMKALNNIFSEFSSLKITILNSIEELKLSVLLESSNSINYLGIKLCATFSIYSVIFSTKAKEMYISDIENSYDIVYFNKNLFLSEKEMDTHYKNGFEILLHSFFNDDYHLYDKKKSAYDLWYFDAIKLAISSFEFNKKISLLFKLQQDGTTNE